MESKFEIPITIKMQVDEATAVGCLKIIEWYVNQTGKKIASIRQENGEVRLSYEPA